MKFSENIEREISEATIDLIKSKAISKPVSRGQTGNFSRRCVIFYGLTVEDLVLGFCKRCFHEFYPKLSSKSERVTEPYIFHMHAISVFKCDFCYCYIEDNQVCLESREIIEPQPHLPKILNIGDIQEFEIGEMPRLNFEY